MFSYLAILPAGPRDLLLFTARSPADMMGMIFITSVFTTPMWSAGSYGHFTSPCTCYCFRYARFRSCMVRIKFTGHP
jgi:hypothetical protein